MALHAFPDQNRPDRAVISITGQGALAWLHNLLTCDVAHLAAQDAAYGALLSPQGKILHDMFVFNAGENVLIDCASPQRATLVQKLSLYRLRAKLMIEIDNDLEVGVHMNKLDEGLRYPDPRHASMGWRSFQSSGSLINVPDGRGYDERRIALGLADSTFDLGVEKTFPHEANFDQFGGVDFKKGCYIGQEVVSRMQHRGTARSRMLPIAFDSKPDDMKVMAGDTLIGEIHSCRENHGLALLRLDRMAEATAPFTAGTVPVRVEKPDWITYAVRTQ
jgi:folate-binding protein YgfZ